VSAPGAGEIFGEDGLGFYNKENGGAIPSEILPMPDFRSSARQVYIDCNAIPGSRSMREDS